MPTENRVIWPMHTTQSSTVLYQTTIGEHQNTTYDHDQLMYLSKLQLCNNLTGLPLESIKQIREQKLNKKRVKTK